MYYLHQESLIQNKIFGISQNLDWGGQYKFTRTVYGQRILLNYVQPKSVIQIWHFEEVNVTILSEF